MLGSGAFGEVRVCVHRESGAQRAVKVLRKSHMDEDEKNHWLKYVDLEINEFFIKVNITEFPSIKFSLFASNMSEKINSSKTLDKSENFIIP